MQDDPANVPMTTEQNTESFNWNQTIKEIAMMTDVNSERICRYLNNANLVPSLNLEFGLLNVSSS